MLVAFVIYSQGGRTAALVTFGLSLVAIISEVLELSFRDNILRRLVPKGPSQNVIATISPRGEAQQELVLIGHVDSHRTSIIFRSAGWVGAYKIFVTISFPLFVIQVLLYGLGVIFPVAVDMVGDNSSGGVRGYPGVDLRSG